VLRFGFCFGSTHSGGTQCGSSSIMIERQPICSNVAWLAVQTRVPSSTQVRRVMA
jgi:hypothetical protein